MPEVVSVSAANACEVISASPAVHSATPIDRIFLFISYPDFLVWLREVRSIVRESIVEVPLHALLDSRQPSENARRPATAGRATPVSSRSRRARTLRIAVPTG